MKIGIAEAIQRTVEHREVFHDEMLHIMRQIMGGELTPAQVAGFIIGLRVKKETIGEIAAAAQVMREFATTVPVKDPAEVTDIVGTGGDAAHTFNVSTAAAFVVAAAGAKVAKHGNRAVSSRSGSADVLESLGANLSLTPEQIAACIEKIGIGFMFAPAHHPAMKHAAPVRKELGVRTIFNILGPLTNPAGAKNQLLGVFHPDLVGRSCTASRGWTRFRFRGRQRSATSRTVKSASTRSIRRISASSCTMGARSRSGASRNRRR
jgi:anthranilate phosphoribosyltransferase